MPNASLHRSVNTALQYVTPESRALAAHIDSLEAHGWPIDPDFEEDD